MEIALYIYIYVYNSRIAVIIKTINILSQMYGYGGIFFYILYCSNHVFPKYWNFFYFNSLFSPIHVSTFIFTRFLFQYSRAFQKKLFYARLISIHEIISPYFLRFYYFLRCVRIKYSSLHRRYRFRVQ